MATPNPRPNKIMGGFPALDRNGRIHLTRQIEQSAQGDMDFIMMMLLSTSLASLGLLADSTAVVIGAMLVAPLMGPLVAAGHALVQANLNLFRKSLIVTVTGIAIGLAASLVFGTLYPGYEPTLEIEARGKADLLDLCIAFFSGMTAAYALGRSNVMTTLAGVAIAAALVPPLAVVGLALTQGSPDISLNAFVLLTTNLVAIILGAAVMFRLFKVHVALHGSAIPVWARRASILLILAIAFLFAPLLIQMKEGRRTGQNRPLVYAVSPQVREAVKQYIGRQPELEVITLGRISVEPEAGIVIVLMSGRILPPDFEEGLVNTVHDVRTDKPPVQIFPLLSAGGLAPIHKSQ